MEIEPCGGVAKPVEMSLSKERSPPVDGKGFKDALPQTDRSIGDGDPGLRGMAMSSVVYQIGQGGQRFARHGWALQTCPDAVAFATHDCSAVAVDMNP